MFVWQFFSVSSGPRPDTTIHKIFRHVLKHYVFFFGHIFCYFCNFQALFLAYLLSLFPAYVLCLLFFWTKLSSARHSPARAADTAGHHAQSHSGAVGTSEFFPALFRASFLIFILAYLFTMFPILFLAFFAYRLTFFWHPLWQRSAWQCLAHLLARNGGTAGNTAT